MGYGGTGTASAVHLTNIIDQVAIDRLLNGYRDDAGTRVLRLTKFGSIQHLWSSLCIHAHGYPHLIYINGIILSRLNGHRVRCKLMIGIIRLCLWFHQFSRKFRGTN